MEAQKSGLPEEHHRHEEHEEHKRKEEEHGREEERRRAEERKKHEVKITINNKEYKVHPGINTVVELKHRADIQVTDELEEVREGVLVPLPNDGSVDIRGGEVFVSHPRDGHSS